MFRLEMSPEHRYAACRFRVRRQRLSEVSARGTSRAVIRSSRRRDERPAIECLEINRSRSGPPLPDTYVECMILRNAEPICHISAYPMIDLSPVRTANAKSQGLSAMEESKRIPEVERIWRPVVV